jgi:hypothetical protein
LHDLTPVDSQLISGCALKSRKGVVFVMQVLLLLAKGDRETKLSCSIRFLSNLNSSAQ